MPIVLQLTRTIDKHTLRSLNSTPSDTYFWGYVKDNRNITIIMGAKQLEVSITTNIHEINLSFYLDVVRMT